uniref:DUF4302 domain-containing protein n=1 Tax=uncultured Draconibacterium sp. TaxID=1573823 RepID=UPI003216A68A
MREIIKLSILLLLGIIVLNGCEDSPYNPFPEDRLTAEEHEQKITEILTGSEYGWKFVLKPDGDEVGGFNTVVKFNNDGTCEMVGDYYEYNYAYGTKPFDATKKQSNIRYGVKHVSNFELSFETYCFIHKLYELNYSSAFQYQIESYSEEEIVISDGRSKMVMTPATSTSWDINKYMLSELKFKQYVDNTILFNYLHKGEAPQLQLSLAFFNRSIGFYYYNEEGKLKNQKIGFYYTEDGMKLTRPLTVPGMESFSTITFGKLTEGEGISKVLNVTLDNGSESAFYSSVRTMVPVDDGIEHFLKVNGISLAKGGRFWSSRPQFEGGFRYGDLFTYFGLEDNPYFSDFSIYLGYYNPKLNNTYNFFSFVYQGDGFTTFFDVYFTYETTGSDQIVFSLDTEKGNGGYSSYIPDEMRLELKGMVDKMTQPEGFTLVSNPYANSIDGSLSLYIVDNKEDGFMYMRTGTLH